MRLSRRFFFIAMVKILTFNEWLVSLYDFNGNGKIDKVSERLAKKKALNNKNYQATQQAYAQYVALAEAANKNEREAQQTQALITAAGQGNEAAATLLTGESKGGTAKSIVLIAVAGAVLIAFLILRRK